MPSLEVHKCPISEEEEHRGARHVHGLIEYHLRDFQSTGVDQQHHRRDVDDDRASDDITR